MKIAYLILAHTDAPQLGRLVRTLAGKETGIFVHIDKKSDETPFRRECEGIDDVYFVEKRIDVKWGGYSIVKAEIYLLRTALESGAHYDRFMMISGTCYPLWSNARLMEYWAVHPDEERILCYNMTRCAQPKKVRQRITTYHFRDLPLRSPLLRHYIIGGLMHIMNHCPIRKRAQVTIDGARRDVYAGSQWWSFTRPCAEYVLDKIDTNSHLQRYFRTAFAPEEIIFHTIIAASPFREHAILREDGVYPGLARATITHYIIYDERGQHTFTADDYDTLVASDRMFCRKVVTGASDELVRRIDEKRKERLKQG